MTGDGGSGDGLASAETEDSDLVRSFREGREEAFGYLVERYQSELYHFLARFVGSRTTAEDLFQETFLQVHQSLDTFDTSKRFKPWLFTIGANKARDHLRKHKRKQPASLSARVDPGEEEGEYIDLLETDLSLPPQQAEEQEMEDLVKQVVQELPDHLREVLMLAYFERMPYKEIAEALSIPLGTVKSRLHSAIGTFADLWQSRYAEPPGERSGGPG